MDKKLNTLVAQLISEENVIKALATIKELNGNELEQMFPQLAFDTQSLAVYGLIIGLLLEAETAQKHAIAEKILSLPLNFIEGANCSALYHLRRAIQLDPDDIEFKQVLLSFHEHPDQLVGKTEAIKVAGEILSKRSDSKIAKRILSEYGVKH